jgi:hypothetical protein
MCAMFRQRSTKNDDGSDAHRKKAVGDSSLICSLSLELQCNSIEHILSIEMFQSFSNLIIYLYSFFSPFLCTHPRSGFSRGKPFFVHQSAHGNQKETLEVWKFFQMFDSIVFGGSVGVKFVDCLDGVNCFSCRFV